MKMHKQPPHPNPLPQAGEGIFIFNILSRLQKKGFAFSSFSRLQKRGFAFSPLSRLRKKGFTFSSLSRKRERVRVRGLFKITFLSINLFFCSSLMAMDHVSVLLDWFINPDHAPLIVAQQQGFFKKQGLHVDLIPPADSADPIKLVAAGQADIGLTYQPEFTVAVSQGLPLVRIGSLINHPLSCLLTLSSSHISTLKDLKGKKIGFDTGNNNDGALKTMLNHVGLQLTDVELINLHFDEVESLLTHQVDAVNGMMRNFEPIELELAGQAGKTFYPEDYGVPTYDELIYVVNKRRVNDAVFKKFMIAMTQATNYLINHPQSCWDSFALQNPALNNELNRRAWFATMPYFAKQPATLDASHYENYTAYLKKTGAISTMPALNDYAVDLLKRIPRGLPRAL